MVVGNGTVCSSLHFSSVQPALLGKQPPMPTARAGCGGGGDLLASKALIHLRS